MDVPSDPGSTNCDQNDDQRPQKWRPQASKMPGLSFQLTSSHRSTNQQWGGRRQGAKPLRIRRARPWPAVGVVGRSPRKVPTFPKGILGSSPVPPALSRAFKNQAFFDLLKKSEKCPKIASQEEPKWSQKSQKSQKNAFRVPLEKQTGKKNRNCSNPDPL